MWRRCFTSAFVCVLSICVTLHAGVVPGRWEKVAAEKPGSKLVVTLMSGDVIECAFGSLSTDSLKVSTPDGAEREYRKSDIARIITADKRTGSLTNGIVIGALAGGIPSGILAAVAASDCYNCGGAAAAVVALCTGIGAGIGLAVDAGKQDHVTLYEAPKQVTEP